MRHASIALLFTLALTLATSYALDGANGYSADQLFTAADVATGATYDTGFAGEAWEDLGYFALGSPSGTAGFEQSQDMAAHGSDLYLIVHGWDAALQPTYTGLVHFDGAAFRNLVQTAMVKTGPAWDDTVGGLIRNVTVSPVTAGRLTAGHPVIVRHNKTDEAEVDLEIWSVDPTTDPATETLVYGWTTDAQNAEGLLAIDGSGVLFVLEAGLLDAGGNYAEGTIRRLEWNGSGYDEITLTSLDARGGIAVGPDGFVYTTTRSWEVGQRSDREIIRIDPTSGAYSTHASFSGMTFVRDWVWDSEGSFWAGLRQLGKKSDQHYVSKIVAGAKLSGGDRITDSSLDPDALAAGDDGSVYVAEGLRGSNGVVYLLTPGSGEGGSGGGGGGKGGGKGKNK